MLRWFLFAIALLCSAPASAQLTTMGVGGGGFGGAAGYTGPLDVVSGAKLWYSCTFPSQAADTSPACNVCLPAGACFDLTISGAAVIRPAGLSTCNITTVICTVKTMYNKGSLAASDITQATQANQPLYVPAMAANGCPTTSLACIKLVPANATFLSTSGGPVTFTQPWTTVHAVDYIADASAGRLYSLGGSFVNLNPGSGSYSFDNGATLGASPALTVNQFYAIVNVANSTSSTISAVNAGGTSSAAGDSGTSAPSSTDFTLGRFDANVASGYATEIGFWQGAFNGTQITNMTSNIRTRNGF